MSKIRSMLAKILPMSVRRWYWRSSMSYMDDRRAFGKEIADALLWSRVLPIGVGSVSLPGYSAPLFYRARSSDPCVLRQVFANRDYAPITGLPDVRLIVDCGANVGYTSFYLLHHYPKAHVIVVEPDSENMALARRNLKPFRDRVTFVQSGVWSDNQELKVERGGYRDGQAWSFQVRACRDGEKPDFRGVTIGSLLAESGFPAIDILKVDIERAELQVFGAEDLSWLSRTRNIAIELHDAQCERVFSDAMSVYEHHQQVSGELTVCTSIQSGVLGCCNVPPPLISSGNLTDAE
jgi:FkbM family methyltransferase